MQSPLLRQAEIEIRNIDRVRRWRLRYFLSTGIVPVSGYNPEYNKNIQALSGDNIPWFLKKQAF